MRSRLREGFRGSSTRTIRASLVALSLASVAVGGRANAQSAEDLDKARLAFRQGVSLEAANNWAAALVKFEEVGRVKLTPQVRFHTARCNEQLGRLNEALGGYRLAEYEAQQEGIPELSAITQARQALETRIPKLVIKRGKGAEVARVELDGVEIGEARIGQPVAVDPGPHQIVAKLPGDKQFEEDTTVKESETAEVNLVAPPDLMETPSAPETHDEGVAPAEAARPAARHSVLPWVVGGVGVAALASGGVFFALRQGAKSDLDKGCNLPNNACPESLRDTQNKGELYNTLTMVSLGVGIVGVGAAAYLFIAQSHSSEKTADRQVHWDAAVGPGSGFVTVDGRF